jgi:hypothetical protein
MYSQTTRTVPSPVFNGAVQFAIGWQPKSDGFLGGDVGMKTAGICGSLVHLNTDELADRTSNTIGSDDYIVLNGRAIGENNGAIFGVDILALLLSQLR